MSYCLYNGFVFDPVAFKATQLGEKESNLQQSLKVKEFPFVNKAVRWIYEGFVLI